MTAARTARRSTLRHGTCHLHLAARRGGDRGCGRDPARRRPAAPRGGRAERAHPQALARGRPPRRRDRRGGARPPLRRHVHIGAGPDSLAGLAEHSFMDVLQRRPNAPSIVVGEGAVTRPDGAAVLAAAASARPRDRRAHRASGPASASCTRRRAAWAGSTWASCQLGRTARAAAMLATMLAEPGVVLLMGADDIAVPNGVAGRTVRLHGPSRRPGRACRRHHPASGLLHREVRHVRQSRGARAVDQPGHLRARRGEG